MSFNTSNNHPLIPNSNQYFYDKKYLSIHSEDRDYTKYTKSSEFEISLPQEYLNIASARLYSWSFPANYDVFSVSTYNVTMTFEFNELYNPGEYGIKGYPTVVAISSKGSQHVNEKENLQQILNVVEKM